jgi:hypothetical protein
MPGGSDQSKYRKSLQWEKDEGLPGAVILHESQGDERETLVTLVCTREYVICARSYCDVSSS